MQITLYKFAKKVNSTARPSGQGINVEVSIKSNVPVANSFDQSADTYLTNPVFFITVADSSLQDNIDVFNYCYAFNKYYWIRNIEIGIDSAIVLYCEIDVLATHKNQIIGTSQYVTYSTAHGNGMIDDSRNLCKVGTEYREIYSAYLFGFSHVDELQKSYDHFYVTMTHDKGTQVLYMTQSQFINTFYPNLISAWNNGSNTWAGFYGAPIYTIGQITASMIDKSQGSFSITKETIKIGNVSLGDYYTYTQGWQLESGFEVPLTAFSVSYKDGDRLANIYVYLPFAGMITIDPSKVYSANRLFCKYAIDYGTMDIGYVIFADYGDYNAIVGEAFGNCGRNVPFGQIINPNTAASVYYNAATEKLAGDIAGQLVSGAAIAAAMPSGYSYGKMLQTAAGATNTAISGIIANEVNSKQSGYSQGVSGSKILGGSFGGSIGALGGLKVRVYELRQQTMYNANNSQIANLMGLPTNKVVTIQADGFYQVPNPVIELDTVSDVIAQIIKLMKGGIYVE